MHQETLLDLFGLSDPVQISGHIMTTPDYGDFEDHLFTLTVSKSDLVKDANGLDQVAPEALEGLWLRIEDEAATALAKSRVPKAVPGPWVLVQRNRGSLDGLHRRRELT